MHALVNIETTGEYLDFYPGYGEFTVKTTDAEFCLDGHQWTDEAGPLPDDLAKMLLPGGCDGIVGNRMFHGATVQMNVNTN